MGYNTRALWNFYLLLLIPLCFAIYEDEVGIADWYQEYIGRVSFAHFNTHNRQMLVATQDGVVSSLSSKNGDIVWRQVFPSTERIIAFFCYDQSLLCVGEHRMRLLSTDGVHLWVKDLEAKIYSAQLVNDSNGDGAPEVVVLTHRGALALYSGSNGERIWEKESDLKHSVLEPCLRELGATIHAIGFTPNSELLVVALSSGSKYGSDMKTTRVPMGSTTNSSTSSPPSFVVTSDGEVAVIYNGQMYLHKLDSNSSSFDVHQPLATLLGNDILSVYVTPHIGIVVDTPKEAILLSGKLQIRHRLPLGGMYASKVDDQLLTCIYSDQSTIFLKVVNSTGETKYKLNLTTNDHGQPEAVYTDGTRLLVVFEDWALCMIRVSDGVIMWMREEALAAITKSEILDLPPDIERLNDLLSEFEVDAPEQQNPLSFLSIYKRRLVSQFVQIKHLLGFGHTSSTSTFYTLSTQLTSKDQFGFTKIIVVLTKSGKVLGLSTDKGQVVWGQMLHVGPNANLYVTRTSTHHPAECVLVWDNHVLVLDPIKGVKTQESDLAHSITKTIMLPIHDQSHRSILLFVTVSGTATNTQIFPYNTETRDLFAANQHKIYFYLIDRVKNNIQGYGFEAGGKFGLDNTLFASLLWKMNFFHEENTNRGEFIVAAAGPQRNEHLHHPAVILGGRNIMPKYFNRNLLAVATSTGITTTAQSSNIPSLNIYLVDTVTGSIIYHTYHTDCGGSNNVRIHQVENSVIYTYWNSKLVRHQASVIDLYEKQLDWSSTEYTSYRGGSNKESPHVLQQSYILPTGIQVVAHTTTQRGITAKNMFLGLTPGRVVSIERRWLDARRPLPQLIATADREEQLIPYNSKLFFSVNAVISYNRTIARLDTISSQGTYLESTSLVFVKGLDIFFTRVSPAELYDLLNRDFNYSALVITVSILLIFTLTSSRLSKRKDVHKLWK